MARDILQSNDPTSDSTAMQCSAVRVGKKIDLNSEEIEQAARQLVHQGHCVAWTLSLFLPLFFPGVSPGAKVCGCGCS